MAKLMLFSILLVFPLLVSGQKCEGAKVKEKVYSTSDAVTSSQTVFSVEFKLDCKNNAKNLFLNADVNGYQMPVGRTGDNQYQVSWLEEHSAAKAGQYDVKIFDEEGFSAMRKAQRDGKTDSKPLVTIPVIHKGVSSGVWVRTEVVVTGASLFVWYMAYRAKSNIQA
ncbi:translocon-associated protein subunit delta-like [Anneissia japonica]|uniref:translocon-associated protein subunit delta-like n=1 Tax=Anneissia japonica TaxID=1529436 RepID=UPI0014254FC2|nr:translocon-associated protein subunit delta-like [Anneissia japonica]